MISIEKVRQRAEADAKTFGYFLNPDPEFLQDLLEGLRKNEERYGYPSCPCRVAAGNLGLDRDIICPCDYRDPDLDEYGFCYCSLYVTTEVIKGNKKITPIPERRFKNKEVNMENNTTNSKKLEYPIWRCKVCGYLCAREEPPDVCPICKVKKERFERFI